MRVAFFGGTFDPPHRGHLAIACAAAAKFALDTILFAPAARQPLKFRGPTASFGDRLKMVELLCASVDAGTRFVPSTLDAPREDGQPNYTIDTLRRLRDQYSDTPETGIFVIIGADSFLDLSHWREPDALLLAAEWIVVSRPGFSLDDLSPLVLTQQQEAHVHLLEGVHEPASATEVRERLEAGLDCSALLTPEVLSYIREHGLYLVPEVSKTK
jgi:nicotinate-nucleotide adenylyltransferase